MRSILMAWFRRLNLLFPSYQYAYVGGVRHRLNPGTGEVDRATERDWVPVARGTWPT